MIFIAAKFRIKPEHAEAWPEISRSFTEATSAEPGCLWFDWSRSLDDRNEYVLVDAFARHRLVRARRVRGLHLRSEPDAG